MRASWAWFLLILGWPAVGWAHGVDEHLHGEREPLPEPAGEVPTAGFTGETFELVAKRTEAGLLLYLADARSNDPLSGAELRLVIVGAAERRVMAEATESAGIYRATLEGPGPVELVAEVRRWGVTELLPVGRLEGGPHLHPEPEAEGHLHDGEDEHHDHADEHQHLEQGWRMQLLGGVSVLSLGLVIGWWWGGRRHAA
jgi:hypothetical protein